MTKKAKVIFLSRYPGDHVRDTRHLSLEQRGAYQEILDQIVILGQDAEPPSLPDDDGIMANLLGVTVARWRKMKAVLCDGPLAVLIVENGRISQARIVEAIEDARGRMDQAAKAGRASGEARRRKSDNLRERMLNGRSAAVPTDVEPANQPEVNMSRASQEPAATNHQSRFKSQAEASTTRDPNIETASSSLLRQVIAIVAPQMLRLEEPVLQHFIDLAGGDAWVAAAVLLQRETYLPAAGSPNYIEAMLRNRDKDLTPEIARGYVEHRLSRLGGSWVETENVLPGEDGRPRVPLDN